ncbi:hypothetical protein HAX54_026849 [Datura stramonium]|uniref:Uncharacterized protein n=1 Tax=Datura stramonium TaxID=4076 RepID=A0ABS8V3Q3_DATST|nr:hypothetical protein [Datura stramonium]
MVEYYIAFKEKRVIHAEAQFDAKSFKTACPDIYYQIGTHDWGPLTIPADSVITLSRKIDKDAPVMNQAKYTGNRTPPPPSPSTHTSATPLHIDEFHSPTPPNLLNIAQRAKMHESQLVRLAKAIPSMIQLVHQESNATC